MQKELADTLRDYVGRESPLYFAERLSEAYKRPDGGRAEIYLKREDLNHTGAHKINNSLGQALLCRRMGKKRIIAETGAGQHGVATATVCAKFGLQCIVYMGAKDMERQELNVFRMRLLGAEVWFYMRQVSEHTLHICAPVAICMTAPSLIAARTWPIELAGSDRVSRPAQRFVAHGTQDVWAPCRFVQCTRALQRSKTPRPRPFATG